MLDFKNGIQFIGLLLIITTAVICFNFACNSENPKKNNIQTVIKSDTIVKYVYSTGKAKKIIHSVMHPGDTTIIRDTAIIYRDTSINLIIENIKTDSPIISYRIKEKIIRDSIFIKDPSKRINSINLGMLGNRYSLTPAVSYNTEDCNYLVGYDVINKAPTFGLFIKLSNIARPNRKGLR